MTAGGGFPGIRELYELQGGAGAGVWPGNRERPRMRALSSAKDTGLLTWERWAQPLDRVNREAEIVFTEKQS